MDGIKIAVSHLVDVPKHLVAKVVFDQSLYVKTAIANLGSEGGIGLVLTALMILIFLGNIAGDVRGLAFDSALCPGCIPGHLMPAGGTINTMVLGGLALVFSRLIDNSVVVLENIFRHLEERRRLRKSRRRTEDREVRTAGAGGDIYYRHRLLPGRLSVRSEPISFHRACAAVVLRSVRFLSRCDDGRASLLRTFIKTAHGEGAPSGTKSVFASFVNSSIVATTNC